MIGDWFDKIVKTERLLSTDSGNCEEFTEYLTGINCQIQAVDDSYSEDLEGSYGKDFLMFCDKFDILQGDRIVDGTTIYLVNGIEYYNLMGQEHLELRIRVTS